MHHLSAVTVIFIHALKAPSELAQCRQEIDESLALFLSVDKDAGSSLARTVNSGKLILGAMLKVTYPKSVTYTNGLQTLDSPIPDKNVEEILGDLVVAATQDAGQPSGDLGMSNPSQSTWAQMDINKDLTSSGALATYTAINSTRPSLPDLTPGASVTATNSTPSFGSPFYPQNIVDQ